MLFKVAAFCWLFTMFKELFGILGKILRCFLLESPALVSAQGQLRYLGIKTGSRWKLLVQFYEV